MIIREYNPKFVPRKAKGNHPKDLLFGFEAELESRYDFEEPYEDKGEAAESFLHITGNRFNKFFFYKYDGSIDSGVEVVTHPFNWNWIEKNKQVIEIFQDFKKHGFKGEKNCGFHVHISRKYFTKSHLKRMLKLYYFNGNFMRRISKRGNRNMGYCDPSLFEKGHWGIHDTFYDEPSRFVPTVDDLIKIKRSDWNCLCKGCALNLYPRNTIEVRLFQGTSNKRLIWAYLEFVKASVLFTKYTGLKSINQTNFKKYLYKNKKLYPNAVKLVRNPNSFTF